MNLKRWTPFALFLLFLAVVIVAKNGGKARWFFNWVSSVPYGDKAGHILLIGTLAFLFNRVLSWRTTAVGRLHLQTGGLIVVVLITLEEISQMWLPMRSFDLGDLAANYTGILIAEQFSRYLRNRNQCASSSGAPSL